MKMEALPPNHRDFLALSQRLLEREQVTVQLAPAIPGPESALELLPSSALPSAQVFTAYPTNAVLDKPDISLAI